MPKFRRATPSNSEVISVHLLHFMTIFDLFEKSCKGSLVYRWGCASKTWSFFSACRHLGAQHSLGAEIWSKKLQLCQTRNQVPWAYNWLWHASPRS